MTDKLTLNEKDASQILTDAARAWSAQNAEALHAVSQAVPEGFQLYVLKPERGNACFCLCHTSGPLPIPGGFARVQDPEETLRRAATEAGAGSSGPNEAAGDARIPDNLVSDNDPARRS